MWQCPECNRNFLNKNQSHYCGESPPTIDAYIELQDIEKRKVLYEVREAIRKVLPDAEERISWKMPTFWKGSNIIHFACFKNHIGIYPGPKAVEHFQEELKEYKSSKGAIQFPFNKPIPLHIIAKIAVWCVDN